MDSVERLIRSGPQPLAQLAQRARNSQTGAAMCQNAAHYLGEATAALAASYWFSRVAGKELTPAVRQQLASILGRGAAFGTWIGLLRECASAAGGDAFARLAAARTDTVALDALRAALTPRLGDDGPFGSKGASLRDGLGRAGSILGFFDFLASFRNVAYGHAWMLPEADSRALAVPFLDAVCTVVLEPALFEDRWLGRTGTALLSQDVRHWKRLAGLAPEFLPPSFPDAPPATAAEAGVLHFVNAASAIPVPFFVVEEEDATGLSRFGFLTRIVGPTKGGRPRPDALKTVEYVGYVSGPFKSEARIAGARELLEKLGSDESGEAPPEDRATAQLAEGTRRFGDFVFDQKDFLGAGAMGEVYRATQLSLGRKVALKVLSASLLSDPVKMGRFNREVQALARCDHPNVVRVLSYGVDEGRPWYAMELVEGADLSRVAATLGGTRGREPLTADSLAAASSLRAAAAPAAPAPADAEAKHLGAGDSYFVALASLFAGASDGLAEIHHRGIVHRDVKPANLLLNASADRLVVMDLGLAKTAEQSAAFTKTEGAGFVGSVLYAAPEQIEARLVGMDHRADIYSLGATLYELATLAPPYEGSVEQVLRAKLKGDPVEPRKREPSVPADLDIVIRTATARDPAMRYPTAEAFAADLRAFAAGRPVSARPPSRSYHLRMFYRQNRALVMTGVAAVVVAFGSMAATAVISVRAKNAIARKKAAAEQLANGMVFGARDVVAASCGARGAPVLELLATTATSYYDAEPPADVDSLRNSGAALANLGDAFRDQREFPRALEIYHRADDVNRRVRELATADSTLATLNREDTISVLTSLGWSEQSLGNIRRAIEWRKKLVTALEAELAFKPTDVSAQERLVIALADLGGLQERLGEYRDAIATLDRAFAIPADPQSRERTFALISGHAARARSLDAIGEPAKQIEELRTGRELLLSAYLRWPAVFFYPRYFASFSEYQMAQAMVFDSTGNDAEARRAYDSNETLSAMHSAMEMLEERLDSATTVKVRRAILDGARELVARHPSEPAWEGMLAIAERDLAHSLGKSAEALTLLSQASTRSEALAKKLPDPGDQQVWKFGVATCLETEAAIWASGERYDDAAKALRRARAVLLTLDTAEYENAKRLREVTVALASANISAFGGTKDEDGRTRLVEEADRNLADATDAARKVAAAKRATIEERSDVSSLLDEHAKMLARRERVDEAEAKILAAQQWDEALASAFPRETRWRERIADRQLALAKLLGGMDGTYSSDEVVSPQRLTRGIAAGKIALEQLHALLAKQPSSDIRRTLGYAALDVSKMQVTAGDHAGSEATLTAAVAVVTEEEEQGERMGLPLFPFLLHNLAKAQERNGDRKSAAATWLRLAAVHEKNPRPITDASLGSDRLQAATARLDAARLLRLLGDTAAADAEGPRIAVLWKDAAVHEHPERNGGDLLDDVATEIFLAFARTLEAAGQREAAREAQQRGLAACAGGRCTPATIAALQNALPAP